MKCTPKGKILILFRVAARVVEEQFAENIKVIVNLNAFVILAENKRVDIAIADNKVKIYINILLNI
jgi:hypothetical protein